MSSTPVAVASGWVFAANATPSPGCRYRLRRPVTRYSAIGVQIRELGEGAELVAAAETGRGDLAQAAEREGGIGIEGLDEVVPAEHRLRGVAGLAGAQGVGVILSIRFPR